MVPTQVYQLVHQIDRSHATPSSPEKKIGIKTAFDNKDSIKYYMKDNTLGQG